MQVYHKVVVSGKITEVYSYQNGVIVGLQSGGGNAMSSGDEKMTKEERAMRDQANLKRSLSRTVQTLRRTINANIHEWGKEKPKFMTLTFKENIRDHDIANKEFQQFVRRLSRRLFKKQSGLKYTCVVERQARGAIHFHVLFYNLPYIPQNQLVKVWENGKEQRGLRINAIDNVDNVGAYVVKYIEKDIHAMMKDSETKTGKNAKEKGKKLYFQATGLYKPQEKAVSKEELEAIESELIDNGANVYEAEHENEYVGKMIYKQYKEQTHEKDD
ncbi:hypothetical protein HNR44_003590 [Geomicrobium halophilum]|uniref:Replication-associated protein ORF2/G2P domain-containing protein n=1 Tax=Geomicrobium halophilum TaxID=549000 RepID=A0A841Q1F3_9BACL|nr:hypothetical protein [Geomicrobium halophilum]MBB6451575.1 hypothetical protein [Geomicrobium halophilum]